MDVDLRDVAMMLERYLEELREKGEMLEGREPLQGSRDWEMVQTRAMIHKLRLRVAEGGGVI